MNYSGECGCGCHTQEEFTRGSHHSGGECCTSGHAHRRFFSKEETISRLEEYVQQLQSEAKGVEEYIEQLKKGKS